MIFRKTVHSSLAAPSAKRRKKGAILIAMLGLFYLMSFLVVQFVETTLSQIRMQAALNSRHEFSTTGYSAMEIVLAVINEHRLIDRDLFGGAQGWRDPIRYAESLDLPEDINISVDIVDETGKIPLNNINIQRMKFLFEEMEIDFSDGEMLVDSLIDWTDEDDLERLNGAEESYYERQDPPVKPANGPITSFETLRYIQGFKDLFFDEETGFPNEKFHQFVESTSLYNDAEININSAPPLVRKTLARELGFDEETLSQTLAGSDLEQGTSDDIYIDSNDELSSVGISTGGEGGSVGFRTSVMKVMVNVSQGEKSFLLTTLIKVAGSSGGTAGGNANNPIQAGDGGASSDGATGGQAQNTNTQVNLGRSSESEDAINYPFEIIRIVENSNID